MHFVVKRDMIGSDVLFADSALNSEYEWQVFDLRGWMLFVVLDASFIKACYKGRDGVIHPVFNWNRSREGFIKVEYN